jgi:hypothetical protein
VTTHKTGKVRSRVYVQVHNRGVLPANDVRVMCLVADCSAGIPALPSDYDANVRDGKPIVTSAWKTLGIVTLNDVRVGFPKVAAFDLMSDQLTASGTPIGKYDHCVLALIHHSDDPYKSITTDTDKISKEHRKAALKNCRAVEVTAVS